jgi:CheY-like chemotaxis protein
VCARTLAAGAAEALQLAQVAKGPIAGAVVDIVLPDMSGLELIRLLLESDYVREAICISGFPPSYIPDQFAGSLEHCFFLQ